MPSPNFRLLFIVCLFTIVSLSRGAGVGYVHNIACATFPGCDFNSDIWNISRVPSANDDVVISSDVQIIIYAKNTNILLHSLSFGTGSSSGVRFMLFSSTLNVTASNQKLMSWGNINSTSSLELYDSNFVTPIVLFGSELIVNNGMLRVQKIYDVVTAIIEKCNSCEGIDWTFSNSSFLHSFATLVNFEVGHMYSEDSRLNITENFSVYQEANITRGTLTVGTYLFTFGSNVFLQDTPTFILQLATGPFDNATVSFTSPNSSSTLTTGGAVIFDPYCDQCNESDSGVLWLGDGVNATFIGGTICHVLVGENVTINYDGSLGFFSGFCDIKHLAPGKTTTINIEANANAFLHANDSVQADIIVKEEGSLTIKWSDFVINGPISGAGSIYIIDGSLTCNDFNLQAGGLLNFSSQDVPKSPPIIVNGGISLESVNVSVYVENGLTSDKIVLMKSLAKSIAVRTSSFQHILAADKLFHLGHSKNEIYVQRSGFIDFFVNKWYYLVIPAGSLIILILLIYLVRSIACKKKTHAYTKLPRSIN